MCFLFRAPITSFIEKGFVWPRLYDIRNAQEMALHTESAPPQGGRKRGLYVTDKGASWKPYSSTDLQLRLCAIGNWGRSGHWRLDTTAKGISMHFY